MKKYTLRVNILILLFSLLTVACTDSVYPGKSAGSVIFYFSETGEHLVSLGLSEDLSEIPDDAQDVIYSLKLNRVNSGSDRIAVARIKPLDAKELEAYNAKNKTEYVALPSECYKISETDISFAGTDSLIELPLTLVANKMRNLDEKKKNVLALELLSDELVNRRKKYIFIQPLLPVFPEEIKLKNSSSVTFIKENEDFDLFPEIETIPNYLMVNRLNFVSSNSDYATVDAKGKVTAKKAGEVFITVSSKKDPEIKLEKKIHIKYPKQGWTVTTSHKTVSEPNGIIGDASCVIDDKMNTCIALVKPGKSYGGITVGENEKSFFTIDMKEPRELGAFKFFHRQGMRPQLRVHQVSVLASNDGENFVAIDEKVSIKNNHTGVANDVAPSVIIELTKEFNYRFIRFELTKWDPASGGTMQIAEIELGS